jgi:galactokinase/mevalonate kinase-like predicted kinase
MISYGMIWYDYNGGRSLYERDILNFDVTLGRWTWDEEKAVKSRISNNVIELMVTEANSFQRNAEAGTDR